MLAKRISDLKESGYSNLLLYTIRKMLVWDEHRRPSFSMLKTFIQENIQTETEDVFVKEEEYLEEESKHLEEDAKMETEEYFSYSDPILKGLD